ncbi:MAG: DNA-binding protein, partial [Bacteroidales bacterium]|nr:DNA-binding protein [Bacteroidales bacterium]
RGIEFRPCANTTLKKFLLRGYAVNYRLSQMENQLMEHERVLAEHSDKIDFFVRTALPPVEGVFYEGQIFDAYTFASDLIKFAKESIVLIDNYIDESVLLMLSKRKENVRATIVTRKISDTLRLDLERHHQQYPPVEVQERTDFHDRFLIIDGTVYHLGASLKDLGKRLFAFSKLELPAEKLL